ncbi:hypothetical protein C7M84_016855 [Penaeus vannamei]|uniref:Uncharacterized protein n=1 Tax=Penaeus vannamei TaxID=6689 RepID=A0A3R7LV14_PENVA|nr:hypothetical protein C7M84_016855 [Penaeus vannamei]
MSSIPFPIPLTLPFNPQPQSYPSINPPVLPSRSPFLFAPSSSLLPPPPLSLLSFVSSLLPLPLPLLLPIPSSSIPSSAPLPSLSLLSFLPPLPITPFPPPPVPIASLSPFPPHPPLHSRLVLAEAIGDEGGELAAEADLARVVVPLGLAALVLVGDLASCTPSAPDCADLSLLPFFPRFRRQRPLPLPPSAHEHRPGARGTSVAVLRRGALTRRAAPASRAAEIPRSSLRRIYLLLRDVIFEECQAAKDPGEVPEDVVLWAFPRAARRPSGPRSTLKALSHLGERRNPSFPALASAELASHWLPSATRPEALSQILQLPAIPPSFIHRTSDSSGPKEVARAEFQGKLSDPVPRVQDGRSCGVDPSKPHTSGEDTADSTVSACTEAETFTWLCLRGPNSSRREQTSPRVQALPRRVTPHSAQTKLRRLSLSSADWLS